MKKIYVGDLGEARISREGITVYFVEEEDGTKSWQLLPDEIRGDRIIKTAKVVPLQADVKKELKDALRRLKK
jgi:hypothetical protein